MILDNIKEEIEKAEILRYILPENDYNNFRIITTDVLNIRREHSTNSDIIGKLYYLNVVKVIDSYPYWLKVEYRDINNDIKITGWICTKYTADFSQETENLLKLNNNNIKNVWEHLPNFLRYHSSTFSKLRFFNFLHFP